MILGAGGELLFGASRVTSIYIILCPSACPLICSIWLDRSLSTSRSSDYLLLREPCLCLFWLIFIRLITFPLPRKGVEVGAPASTPFRELSRTHGVIIEGNFTKSYKDSEVPMYICIWWIIIPSMTLYHYCIICWRCDPNRPEYGEGECHTSCSEWCNPGDIDTIDILRLTLVSESVSEGKGDL